MLTRYIRRITVGMGGAGEEQGKAGEWEWGFKSSNHYTFFGDLWQSTENPEYRN